MKVIIPMSGMSSRFAAAGYEIPKYLIEVDGKKVIEHIVNLYPEDSNFIFIINDKHKEETNIVDVLDKLVEKKKVARLCCHDLTSENFVISKSDLGKEINACSRTIFANCSSIFSESITFPSCVLF